MNTRRIQQDVTLFYPPEERKAADTMEVACKRSLALNIETWAIAPRRSCRLFVMTSCFGFLFKLLERKWSHRAIYKIIADELEVPLRTAWASLVRIAHDFFCLDEGHTYGAQISG